jgi:hypothetical protein
MKPIPRIITIFLAFVTMAHSQGGVSTAPRDSTAASVPSSVNARILGEIPDGAPLPPAAPKPESRIASGDILETASYARGGRTITIRQIKPITLPPPPAPVAQSAEVNAEFNQRLTKYREEHPKSGLLFLGATVFRLKESAPRTLVRFWPEGGREVITFWSSADFALIAGGINSFVDSAGDSHHLMIGWGNVDIDRMSELQTAKGREYLADMPEFAEGKATFRFVGKQPSAEDLVPIHALHDLYNNELARLKTAYEGREAARIKHEAYLKAHPPQPKDITLNYWRVEQAASKGKGEAAR